MEPKEKTRTYSREDRSLSLAPLGFDEAVTDLLSVPAPPKKPKTPEVKAKKGERAKKSSLRR